MRELTLELTNYCPHFCEFCSSCVEHDRETADYLDIEKAKEHMQGHYDIIHLSGGEPLAHPDFYNIYLFALIESSFIIVHTNLFRAITFNAHIITGIQVEANITLENNTEKLHVLKRCDQGYETLRPKIHHSRNFNSDCIDCNHKVILPNGLLRAAPCKKEKPE